MGRKRKKAELKPFCFFCDRAFADEGVLIAHQKTVHFKCLECKKRLTGLQALIQHSLGVHKLEVKTIPGARPDRDTVQYNILGMAGVPQELVDQKQAEQNADKRAKNNEGGVADGGDEEEGEVDEAQGPAAAAAGADAAAAAAMPPPPPPPGAYPAPAYPGAYPPYGGYPGAYGAGGHPNPYAPRAPQPIFFQQQRNMPTPYGFPGAPMPPPPAGYGAATAAPYAGSQPGTLPPPPLLPAHVTMQLPPPPPPRPGSLPLGGAAPAVPGAVTGSAVAPAAAGAAGAPGTAAAPITLGSAAEGEDVVYVFEEGSDGLSMEERRASLSKYRAVQQ